MSTVENLASEIIILDEKEQQKLWEKVAELNFSRGLNNLSRQYRERLRMQGELDRSAQDILSNLKQTREEIAVYEYTK